MNYQFAVSCLAVVCVTQLVDSARARFPWLAADPETQTELAADAETKYSPLPFAITSFGAARLADTLFVYGGNMGDAHEYHDQGQSGKLLRLDLSTPDQPWQEVATGSRLQGLAMVGYQDRLILLGGFSARNPKGTKQDLHSSAEVRVFNVKTQAWSQLPALPEPRSSHDAALIESTIYVVGGWNMAGRDNTTWHQTAWSMDLADAEPKWTALPKPPFVRRAVATIEHHGELFVVGGMDESGSPTKAVAIYNPATKEWREVAKLSGEKDMAGFGVSGWSIADKLIVTTHEGAILQWMPAESQGSWKVLGNSDDARFFHRILPLDARRLIAIGGASMEVGKYTQCEVIEIP